MAKFDKLAKAFEDRPGQDDENSADSSKFRQLDTLQQSIAIVKTIEKLKAQGVAITKKAELDYLLAKQVLDKANISPAQMESIEPTPSPPSESSAPPLIKRNPKDHPEEFKTALEFSRKTVAEVEELQEQGKPIPVQQMETYELCKKFLKKYT